MKTVKLTGTSHRHRWGYLIGFSPLLALLFYVNGVFSVRGFPFVISVVAGATSTAFPSWIILLVSVVGWAFVVSTSKLEGELIQMVLEGQAPWISPERWVLTGVAVVYDYVTTAAGLYQWLGTLSALGGLVIPVAILLAVLLTFAVEGLAVAIWRLQ